MEPCRPQHPQENILAGIPPDPGHRQNGRSHPPNHWSRPNFRPSKRQQWRPPHGDRKGSPLFRRKRQELVSPRDDLRLRNPFRRDYGGAAQPLPKAPQIVSPNIKAQKPTFSKVMDDTFKLKDPMALGKRLASLTSLPSLREPNSCTLQRSFDPGSADESSSGVSSSSTRFGKQTTAPKPELLSPTKIKSEALPFNPFGVKVKTEPSPDLTPAKPQSSDAAANFCITPPSSPNDSTELATLFRLIETNTQQSMMLGKLVSRYLDSSSDSSTDGVPTNASSKPFRRNRCSHGYPLVATLSGGGGSPDPPSNPHVSFRGHMIDKVGFDGAGPETDLGPEVDLDNLWMDDSRSESPQLGSANDETSSSTKDPPTPPSSPTQYCGICGYGVVH